MRHMHMTSMCFTIIYLELIMFYYFIGSCKFQYISSTLILFDLISYLIDALAML